MSANAALLEAQIRHQVMLQRRGAGMANDVIPMVERIIEQVVARVVNTPDQRARQAVMISELRSILSAAYAEIGAETMQHVMDLGEYEAQYQVGMMGQHATASFAKPAIEQIVAAIDTNLLELEPGQQMTIKQALDRFGDTKSQQIIQTIQDGIVQQQTNAQIAQSLGELKPLHKRQVDALVRTVANGAATAGKETFYRENAGLIKHYRYTATLDSRTRLEHQALDASTYERFEDAPRTPHGWNCRCVIVPVVRDDLQLPGFEGERPFVGSDGKGTVSARTTYSGFLKSQSVDFQNETLGPARAKLFRSGKVSLSDMVNRYGEPLTLSELRVKEGM